MIPTLRKIRGGQSKQIWGGGQYRDIVRGGQLKKTPRSCGEFRKCFFFQVKEELRDVWSDLKSNQFTKSLQKSGFTQLVAVPTHIQGGKYQILEFLPTSLLSVDISSLQSGALDHVYVRRMSWLLWSAELVSSHFSSQLCIFMWKFVQRQVCCPELQDAMSLQ